MNGQPMTCRGCRALLPVAWQPSPGIASAASLAGTAKKPDLLGRAVWVQNVFDDDDGDSIL